MKFHHVSILSIMLVMTFACHTTIIKIKTKNLILGLITNYMIWHQTQKKDLEIMVNGQKTIASIIQEIEKKASTTLKIKVKVDLFGAYDLTQNKRGHINLADFAYALNTLSNESSLLDPNNKDDNFHYFWAVIG